jgi:fatty acid amide hydrolase 2
MEKLLQESATSLAKGIREGQYTSRQVVDAHIVHIERVNPTLNAVVKDRFDIARKEAEAADFKQKAGEHLPLLHGVPCTIKECFAFEGMPNSCGLYSRRNVIAQKDATAVERLRTSGAIPMGVTNISELCMWMESHNTVYGRTNNPYNPARIVGGSSGGEGAIIGAGASPFGLGSDIGGSIRMPAFFNGVFGHKPSGGLVPNTGMYPDEGGALNGYLTTGPLARRAEDLYTLVKILAGPDGIDKGCKQIELKDPASVDLSALKVYTLEQSGAWYVNRVQPELRRSLQRAAKALEGHGATVQPIEIPEFKQSMELWSATLHGCEGVHFDEIMADGQPIYWGLELLKSLAASSHFTQPGILLSLIEKYSSLFGTAREAKLRVKAQALRDRLNALLADGVLLYPPYPAVAPPHQLPKFTRTLDWVHTAIFNALELPVSQVPLGLGRIGLPLGVQVVSAHGNDHITLACALSLEKSFGGWVMPKQFV